MKRFMKRFIKEGSNLQSILKTFSWRVTATTTTVIISLIATGSIGTALSIGASEFVAKLLIYYFHERLWVKISID